MSYLPDVEQELLIAARRRYGPQRARGRLHRVTNANMRRAAVVGGLLLAVSAAASAIDLLRQPDQEAQVAARSPDNPSVAPELVRSLGVLSRPATEGDGLPSVVARMLTSSPSDEVRHLGLQLDGARRIASLEALTAFLIPGQDGACIATTGVEGHGFTCDSKHRVATLGLATSQAAQSETPGRRIIGLVPDGVERVEVTALDGGARHAVVSQNGFAVDVPGEQLESVVWLDRDGEVIRSVAAP